MNQLRKALLALAILCLVIVTGAAVFVYSGIYNVGADDPHTRPMFALMQTVRSRSIHVRSKDIAVPKLDDEQLILKGAGQYAAMCTGCHLKPGMTDSEIRSGLYPQPPNLSQLRVDPQDAFWVIKHGLKMSAMPAWGLTHDDDTIWSMVAFLQKLPDLTPAQYKDIVAKAPPDEDMDMGEEGGHHHHHRRWTRRAKRPTKAIVIRRLTHPKATSTIMSTPLRPRCHCRSTVSSPRPCLPPKPWPLPSTRPCRQAIATRCWRCSHRKSRSAKVAIRNRAMNTRAATSGRTLRS